jgi:hypothetical protein
VVCARAANGVINEQMNPYTITKVLDRVYLLKFADHYDLCMTFLRYQEFYESDNLLFRGHSFNILDYMEWQAHTYGDGVFNYPDKWSGFNIPSSIIDQVNDLGIEDRNRYDERMWNLHHQLKAEVGDDYYLIGVSNDDTIDHEVAHGLWFVNQNYRQEMEQLIDALPPKTYGKICDWLTSIDYAEASHRDEVQAYLATGLGSVKVPKKTLKQFSATFNRYIKTYAQAEKV